MRCALNATGFHENLAALVEYAPSPLLRVADKEIVFYVIEYLADLGIRHIEVICHHLPQEVKRRLGDGSRWGVEINYHLAKSIDLPYNSIRSACSSWLEDTIVLGDADSIPGLDHRAWIQDAPQFVSNEEGTWTGWASLRKQDLSSLPRDVKKHDLKDHVKNISWIKSPTVMSCQSFNALLSSNQSIISNSTQRHLLPASARLERPGVWISRGAKIHPSVHIEAPAFVGENCEIRARAKIGPGAIVENHCLVDHNCRIQDSLICRNSYIGESLNIENSVVDRNRLVNTRLGTDLSVTDDFIISEIGDFDHKGALIGFMEKSLALLCLLITSPLMIYKLLFCTQLTSQVVQLPSKGPKYNWKYFSALNFQSGSIFIHRLPQLFNILKGEMHFVGIRPRTPREMEDLPSDWRNLCLQSKLGIIHVTDLLDDPSDDDIYSAEAYYLAKKGPFLDAQITVKLCYNALRAIRDNRPSKYSLPSRDGQGTT